MKAYCIKDYITVADRPCHAGNTYSICPVLSGYQVSTIPNLEWDDPKITYKEVVFIFADKFNDYFALVKEDDA